MRYGLAVNNGRIMVGNREEIKTTIVGALLATGFTEPMSVEEKADKVLQQADGLADQSYQVGLENGGELEVWLERGAAAKGRVYRVQVGKDTPFRMENPTVLIAFIAGLMSADGASLEKSTALGEGVAFALSEGGGYPDRVVTELRDRREVRAWSEDGTAGAL